MSSDLPQCEHGQTQGFCFECLSPEEQAEHTEVWARLIEIAPDLAETIEQSRREIAEGKVIRLQRGPSGRSVVMPHSLFREVIDIVHEDKMNRGTRD